ncbi:hypothetical protein K443DRAFT_8087 [Laccaria amethystina LaAM-08-1]|uniref:Uncharacterized protein n=1 Tax=Laccaria amethystina LaAM-08-1 TaxID=1095629 RepID=A0A0C9XQF0_9AGAR|nr:hypothetical protein K443DRAFT_8087 [Laccaria amethystina LaAM-08-1]
MKTYRFFTLTTTAFCTPEGTFYRASTPEISVSSVVSCVNTYHPELRLISSFPRISRKDTPVDRLLKEEGPYTFTSYSLDVQHLLQRWTLWDPQRALADSTTIDSTPADPNSSTHPTKRNLSRVTTTRPSYSFTRAGSAKSTPPASRSASRSSSPKKRTTKTTTNKSTSQELASASHKKAHIEAISKSAPFRSKTSLTPRSAGLVEIFNNTPTSPIHALNFSAVTPSQTSTTLSNVHVSGEFKTSDKSKLQQTQPTITANVPDNVPDSGAYTASPPPTTG